MKILIAADMEGITGVTHWEETDPANHEYTRYRKIMTDEVNEAIAGAADAGAEQFIVADGHGDGTNILIEELDSRAKLNSGGASPMSMMQGVDSETGGVIFIGYHARAGSQNAVLAHTWSAGRIANVWLNQSLVGEYGLNAALAGHFNVPVIMISGDQTACEQAVELIGSMETAIVKRSTGYFSAECLPLKITLPLIREKSKQAVLHLRDKTTPKPFVVATPVHLAIEFRQPESADRSARLPGALRVNGLRVEFIIPTMLGAHAVFRAAVKQSYD